MSTEQLRESVKAILDLLGNTPSYRDDPNLWEAVSHLAVLCSEIIAKLPEDA